MVNPVSRLKSIYLDYKRRTWSGRLKRPIFIVGSARSGTTFFGQVMDQTPDFRYLNEQRKLWLDQVPTHRDHLKWVYDESDYDPVQADNLSRIFDFEVYAKKKLRLVEKTPINAMRIAWLVKMFPDAQFLHIIRHPRDAATSMAKKFATTWKSEDGRIEPVKVGAILHFAVNDAALNEKIAQLPLNLGNYGYGLLRWLIFVQTAIASGKMLPASQYHELKYEDLICNPEETLTSVYDFLDEELPPVVLDYALKNVKATSIDKQDPDPRTTQILVADWAERLGYEL